METSPTTQRKVKALKQAVLLGCTLGPLSVIAVMACLPYVDTAGLTLIQIKCALAGSLAVGYIIVYLTYRYLKKRIEQNRPLT